MELAFEDSVAMLQRFKAFVSILLIVELAFEESSLKWFGLLCQRFQSFLSWNWPLKAYSEILSEYDGLSFNPSYRGIGL